MNGRETDPSGLEIEMERRYPFSISAGAADVSRSAPLVFRGDFYKSVELAKQAGFDAVEFHLRKPDQIDPVRMQEVLEQQGMRISAVATGMGWVIDKLSLIEDDADIRSKAVERLKEHIDFGARLNYNIVIGNMRGNIPDFDQYGKYEQRLIEGMKQLAEYAEAKKVDLLLEAINRYEINYLNSVGETLELIEKVKSPRLKVHIDTYHMNIEDTDLEQSVIDCGEKLGYVHISDSNRKYPGAGHIDFGNILNALDSVNYKGYLAVEILPGTHPMETAQKSVEYLNSIIFGPKI